MNDASINTTLSRAQLVLRITVGLFLLQWGIEKFVVPAMTVAVWGYFYGVAIPQALGYGFGAAEIAIALCIFAGRFRTVAYGAAVVLHAVTVAVSWRQLTQPWANEFNHLFIASVPVLGAMVALFLLRDAGSRPAVGAAQR